MNSFAAWLRAVVSHSPADRRRSPRTAFKSSIEVRTASGELWRGVARDLSRGGLGAVVYADLQVGDSVVLRYAPPEPTSSGNIVARSAFVRSRFGWRYGFEFYQG